MMQWPYKLQSVLADPETFLLHLTWADGTQTTVDMNRLIREHRAFKLLADKALFAAVQLTDCGLTVEWMDDIDMSADSLWYDSHPEDDPFAATTAAAAE